MNFVPPASVPETTNVQPLDDDDVVIVPAAPLSSLGPRPTHRPVSSGVPLFKSLVFRRTAIPVLLTSGLLMLAVAGFRYVVDPDSVLALLPPWISVVLLAAAALLLLVAALNMAQVRQQLTAESAGRAGSRPSPGAT